VRPLDGRGSAGRFLGDRKHSLCDCLRLQDFDHLRSPASKLCRGHVPRRRGMPSLNFAAVVCPSLRSLDS